MVQMASSWEGLSGFFLDVKNDLDSLWDFLEVFLLANDVGFDGFGKLGFQAGLKLLQIEGQFLLLVSLIPVDELLYIQIFDTEFLYQSFIHLSLNINSI